MNSLDLDYHHYTKPIIDGLNHWLTNLPRVLIVLLAGILAIQIATKVLRFTLTLTNIQLGLRGVLVSVVRIILWLFLSIKVLELLGFSNIIVFFSGSVAAIGIAMAAGGSTLISDIVAGIFLARDDDFNVGDEVIIGEGPTRGTIESIDARRTRVRDPDGVLHVLPNSLIERKEWVMVRRSHELTPLTKVLTSARKLRTAALENRAVRSRKKADPEAKSTSIRKNAQ